MSELFEPNISVESLFSILKILIGGKYMYLHSGFYMHRTCDYTNAKMPTVLSVTAEKKFPTCSYQYYRGFGNGAVLSHAGI